MHILDAGQDGLAQIAAIVAGRSGLAALHLISHGAEASANLGTLVLDTATAQTHAAELAAIGAALAPGADILLYGCDIGAGADGAALLGELAIRTGADIAASTTPTGAAALGGDWKLEIATGDIEATPLAAPDYTGLLPIASATLTFGNQPRFFDNGGSAATGDVIYSVNGLSGYRLVIDGATKGVRNYGSGYIFSPTGGGETRLTMSFQGGNVFTPTSLSIENYTAGAQTIVFRGYDALNNQVGTTQSISTGSGFTPVTISFSGLTAISSLRMSATTNGNLIRPVKLDDFALSNIQAAPCFAAGTRIASARGMLAVEALRIGDRLTTVLGGATGERAVVWIGHRQVDLVRHPRPQDVQPVCVAAHAFGPGEPARDLWLSPDHAVHAGGVLIPVRYLINGSTIRQEARTRVTYWHVELDAHDVILAEGLACESFLDTGNRDAFLEGGGTVQVQPDFALKVWAAAACAPLAVDRPAVEAVRRQLAAQAEGLGHRRSSEAGLHLAAGARRLAPLAGSGGGSFLFELPPGAAGSVRLRSRSFMPAEIDPAGVDWRRLGVLVTSVRLDGAALDLAAVAGDGWHAAEPEGRWTNGDAVLHLPAGACSLKVGVAEVDACYPVERVIARHQAA